MVFRKLQRMNENLPDIYLSEPEFQQKAQKLNYTALVKQLGNSGGRFRLDYWNLGQVVLKLSTQENEKPDYLVFVSVSSAILNNDAELKRVVELLNTTPEVAKRMVLAFQYQDCMTNIAQLGKVIKLLKVLGVHLAIDGLPDSSQALKFVQVVKPALVRVDANVNIDHLQRLIEQLVDRHCKVIIPSEQDQNFLKVAYSTAAAYVQVAT